MTGLSANRLIPMAGFLLLSTMVVVLLGFTVYEAWTIHTSGSIIVAIILIGVLAEIGHESRRVPCVQFVEAIQRDNLLKALAVLGGALAAYTLSHNVGLGAVTASGLVGLLAAFFVPDLAVPAYCGSFVGMTSVQLLGTHWEMALAGVVTALLYLLTECAYPGLGGKLGTIAFTGSAITGLGLERQFVIAPIPEGPMILLIIACATVATVVTYWLNVKRGHGGVIASGVVAIAGGLILPAVDASTGPLLAVVVICASFAGMSSRSRFPHFSAIALIGLMTGIIFVYSTPLMGGAGGKLGTIAFAAGLAMRGYADMLGTVPQAVLHGKPAQNTAERRDGQQIRGS